MSPPPSSWTRFWFAESSLLRLGLFRVLVASLLLTDLYAYSRTVLSDAAAVTAGRVAKPWNPIYLFEVLGLEPVGSDTAELLYAVAMGAAALGLLGLFTRTSLLVACVLWIHWTGLAYSFGKVHHEKVTLAFTLCFLPFSPCGARVSLDALLRRWWRRRAGDARELPATSPFAGLPIRIAQVTMALGYGFAGATKLVMAGPEWANGYTLMGILMHYHNEWSAFFCQSAVLCQVASVGTLVAQVGFPLVLVWPASRWFFLPVATFFHIATWFTMDTGPYITLWLFALAFVPLERVHLWLARGLNASQAAVRAWHVTVVAIPALLVAWVYWLYWSWWLVPPVSLVVGVFLRQLSHAKSEQERLTV